MAEEGRRARGGTNGSGIAIGEEHAALGDVVRRLAEDCGGVDAVARAVAGGGAPPDDLAAVGELGWLGLGVPVAWGGSGFGLLECGLVIEALADQLVVGSALTAIVGATVMGPIAGPAATIERVLAGEHRVGLALGAHAHRTGDRWTVPETSLLGGADVALVGAGDDVVVFLPATDEHVHVAECSSVDPTRAVFSIRVDEALIAPERILVGGARRLRTLAAILAAADAVGGARACVARAADYACTRRQFDRPVGSFQAVKHLLADAFALTELATAAVWDALRAPGSEPDPHRVAVAGALAHRAFPSAAKVAIQVHGGIGCTYEHPAHLYLRRAASLAASFGGSAPRREVAASARRAHDGPPVALPEEAEEHRREIAAFLARYDVAGDEERTALLADSGYLFPHWPRPWGRDAGPVEQLVVESELAPRVRRPFMGLAGWCAASIVAYGSREQQERWVRPTLRGEASWCQLFSEPEAGSDLAAVRTRATRVEKGWRLTGQKVWTSMAHRATSGLCLARTDPDAPKHRGLSIFVVDMRAPGVQVRPLRELTGHPTFNEVFLDDVALSEDAIIGQPGQGWEIARTTLANERVSMGGATTTGDTAVAHALLDLLDHSEPDDARRVEDVGQLIAEHRALDLLAARRVERALVGANPGPESSVAKLLGSEHEQRVADCAMEILGPAGSVDSGVAAPWFHKYLFSRVLTIAGGTSQVLRNVIAERVLGLPRDP